MKKIVAISLSVLILSGCATQKQMTPMGGSKADGTVRMGYNFGMFEKPVVDLNSAKILPVKNVRHGDTLEQKHLVVKHQAAHR